MTPLRVVYAGTPDFAVPPLRALVETGYELAAVYTQPDRPAGRGRQLRPSPVKIAAEALGLPIEQPVTLRDVEAYDRLAGYRPDVMVVAAYGLILPQAILDLPRLGCLNIHASLLPRWRGAAPIQRAIEAGDVQTGVTIMQMEAGLDTGPMLGLWTTDIRPEDTGGSVHDRLAELGAAALLDVLPRWAGGAVHAQPQDETAACYARKLTKDEAGVDWSRPAHEVARKIQAFNPWPGAETGWNGQKLKLHLARALECVATAPPGTVIAESREGIDVAAGDQCVRLLSLQLPGKRAQSAAEFINGRSLLGQTLAS
ncbi:methionyl-tRNA formyltransferase [Acidihalobacter aeolianus]|uniref:Methionyl-tRNA formyltransferase n=1 Tax=Acidihalobacter aeolianus TaxID=2792603 RepID=A0A1D8KB76_9GAMM|nr:methionyl-tRNA formyltransferase [Acidihalobacter aeolianus]AOV18196.1 methionyl-tRNA formyltransferase [Acidihalobacter aeolianus]